MKRLYDLANLALLILIGVFAFRSTPRLPARVPMHFDMAGQPDRWGSREGLVTLFVLPAILTAVLYLMVSIVPRLAANPRSVNIPRKEEFLRLPAEKQEIFWALFKEFFAALAASLNLLFYVLLRGAVEVSLGAKGRLPLKNLFPALALMGVLMVYFVWRMMTLPGKLIRGEE
jgi:uncharacterized membrane protein